jgi:uncharacterized protein YjbI with pentapeptide repeats
MSSYKRHIKTISFLIVFMIMVSCQQGQNASRLYTNKPDTTNLLGLLTHLSPEYISKRISETSITKTGTIREPGNPSSPKNEQDFRDYHFDNVYWKSIQITDADFRGCYFRSAFCEITDFSYSDFSLGNLQLAKFNKATLLNCQFDQASLIQFKANEALIDQSSFQGANMFGVQLHNASLRECDFSNAILRDAQLAGSDFTRSKALKASFMGSMLYQSHLDSCDLSYSNFSGANLEESSFINTRILNGNFFDCNLANANFQGADLKGCDFTGAYFRNTNFKDAIHIPAELKNKIKNNHYSGEL